MKCILFIVFFMAGFLSVSAQTYNEWIDKSFECIESEDWTGAEKALIGALRVQPANPQNALLLSNLGTIQRKMGKNDEALKSYTNAEIPNKQDAGGSNINDLSSERTNVPNSPKA